MVEPPCICPTPQYHQPGCRYKAWIDAGKPQKEEEELPITFPTSMLYCFYNISISSIRLGPHASAPGLSLDALKKDIAANKLQKAIIVKPIDDVKYQIKDGNRRFKACQALNHDRINCFIVP